MRLFKVINIRATQVGDIEYTTYFGAETFEEVAKKNPSADRIENIDELKLL